MKMNVKVKAFSRFREILGSETNIQLDEGVTVSMTLESLANSTHDFRDACFDREGNIASHVVLMINGKRISGTDRGKTVLHEGDELAIFPPVAGG
jgi:sulfur-carrier protein